MAKKKEPEALKDKLVTWACLLGGLLVLVTIIPNVPWRVAAASPMLTSRFSMARTYSLFSIGTNLGQPVSWMKMRGDLCKKVQEMSVLNPITALVGTVVGSIPGVGGALGGCSNWAACKDHAVQRCAAYGTLAAAGMACLLLNLVGAIASFMVPVMKSMELQGKKKKDQDAARKTTMVTTIVAFACPFVSTVTWVGLSDSTFKQLQRTAFFPYPAASAGAYLAGVGVFILFVGMFCGITRVYPLFRPKEAQTEEEYADAVPEEAAALLPGLGMGPPGMGPPGMGPGMGMGMGPPGMGPPLLPPM